MNDRLRVVVVGGGFGGLEVARRLAGTEVDVVLIDRSNHHLFQPLLYQVATGVLAPSDIAYPLRRIFRGRRNVQIVIGDVEDIDCAKREVICDGRAFTYDRLVIAAGATDHWFGNDHWERYATGLKSLSQAIEIRNGIIRSFEEAAFTQDPATRRRWLTFVIVGGGPTGVEVAGAVKQLAVDQVDVDFPEVDLSKCRVILVQGADRLLPSFHPSLGEEARRSLEAIGVEVRVGCRVTEIDEHGVVANGERIETQAILWAAGVRGAPLGARLGVELDGRGRVPVQPDLRVVEHPNVFAIGDIASVRDPETGDPVPGVAQGAIQMGRHVARVIRDEARDRDPGRRGPFRYRDKGSMATIGRGRAVVEFGSIRLRGWLAWLLWGFVHVAFLVGFRNKLGALFGWVWAYVFFSGGTEIISRPFHRSDVGRKGTGTPSGGGSSVGGTLRRILRR